MIIKPRLLFLCSVALLAGCGEGSRVNAPTDPAEAIGPAGPGASPLQGTAFSAGPGNFVGRWAASSEGCSAAPGQSGPITITLTRFEGYENSCDIQTLLQEGQGYDAGLRCESEGTVSSETVRLVATADELVITYPERGNETVRLTRCPLAETQADLPVQQPVPAPQVQDR